MQAVILAGGLGTRISEETMNKPKPMVQVGGMPILWHIMKIYSSYGINEFIICLGYKGYEIKEFFANYYLHSSDLLIDTEKNIIEVLNKKTENWKINLIETGLDTMVGGRIKKIIPHLKEHESFCLTYGDGLSNINISMLIKAHNDSKKLVTMTAVNPPGRFGSIEFGKNGTLSFGEKKTEDNGWINGGFFVCSPKIDEYIDGNQTVWEKEPLQNLIKDNELNIFKHNGFWQPMDTLRDKTLLDELWLKDNPPWKTWE